MFFFQSKVWIAVVTSKAPRGGGKLNGFHNLTASLRSAEGASLRSAGARFARLGLASLAWGAHMPRVVPVLPVAIASNKYLYHTGGPNIPVTLKHITGICRKCVNLQLGYCSHCPFMDTEGL